MRRVGLLALLILSVVFGARAQKPAKSVAGDGANTDAATHDFASARAPRPSGAYGDLPLSFERNRGQADSQVKYLARGRSYTLFLTPQETVLALRHPSPAAKQKPAANAAVVPPGLKHETVQWAEDVVRFKLAGASANPKMEGVEKLPGVSNYYIGNDPSRWQSGIPNYRKVVYRDAYPGIDVTYYGNPGLLESDFVVAPGADPSVIEWDVEGAPKIRVNEAGDLILETADASMRLQKPVVYQMVAGERREVTGAYRIDRNTVRFAVGGFDRSQTLIIDPTLSYSTYLGGSNGPLGDVASDVGVDTSGEAYVVGSTSSTDFPTQSPAQGSLGSGATENAFVTKFSADGSALLFSTYFGGSGTDRGFVLALDAAANAYIVGPTTSDNFPLKNPLQGQGQFAGAQCGYVSSFSPAGSLLFSTYLCGGGFDTATLVVVDGAKNVYVAGNTSSANFPTTPNPLQPTLNGATNTFITKLAPITANGSTLVFSTFFGGNGNDFNQGLALDSSNNVYVAGSTSSTMFPTKNPIQATLNAKNGGFNAFIAEINAAGNALVYSTYLGGSVNDINEGGLAVDPSGNAYVAGIATSPDFPLKNSLQALDNGGDAYIAKIAAGGGSLDFSTFFGGGGESPEVLQLDSANNIYIAGATRAVNFPTRIPLQATFGANQSTAAFITEFKNDGSDYIFSSYLAGSSSPSFQGDHAFGLTLDSKNNIYVVGQTSTLDFPTVSPFQPELKNTASTNGFVAKIAPATPAGPQLFPASLNFGSVITATPSQPQIVTLANGTTALDITSIVVSGQNAADFNSFSTCGQTVPATVVCNFTVIFTPSTTGAEAATVTINESSGTQSFSLSGIGETAVPPPPPGTISINPSSLAFANQEVSVTSAFQFFTVTVGTNPVTLQFTNGTGADPFDFIQGSGGTNPCSFETPLPVGTVCQIAVAFDPQAVGARSATFQLFGTFTGSPAGVAVSGTGTAKIASLTPPSLSFPNQVVNTTSSPMTVTLANVSGPGGPTLTSIAPSVPTGFAISSTTCPVGAGLGPGQSCTFSVVFSPTSAGSFGGPFTVTDSDPALQFVELSGVGLNATATLAPIFPTSLQFGRQTAGTTSAVQSVFLQNTGNTNLAFTTPLSGASPNAFQATNSCSGTITPGTFCIVSVTFTPPTGTGPFFATLTIQSAAVGAPQTVALSGTGIPASTASLLPNPLVFPATAVGQSSAPEYAFLNNTGPNAETVQTFTIIGADPQDFQLTFSAPAQSCTFGTILNAQAVCVIGVVFTPTQTGQRTATLQVIDTATGTPQAIPLQGGTATAATLTVVEVGTGSGAVTSNPSGINCPTTCVAGFTSGQAVTLSATANPGSTFGGFSTNCIPANPQTNPPSCTVTLSGAATTVTATFNTGGGGLTISPSTLPNGAIGAAYGQTLQVSGGVQPFNFTISAGTLPAGLNLGATTGTIAGVPTGPAGPSTFTVMVTDSSTPPLTGSATFTITIAAADNSNNSELNGEYAFLFQGFNDSDGTMVVVAGSFVADGHGNILPGGFEDADSVGSTGTQPPQEIGSGSYTIGADHRGSMSLTTLSGTTVLAISVGDIQAGVATKARFIRFDDVSGTSGHTGSGVILKQDPSIFALAAIKGSYAFGESGSNLTNGNPESGVGFLNSDGNGNFTPAGLVDLNDGGGTGPSEALSGTYALTSETVSSGRLSASVTVTNVTGTVSDVVYIVSSSEFIFISINTTQNTVYSGIAQLQVPPAGGFGLGSLNGNSVVAVQGKRSNGTSVVLVGNAASDGKGNFTLAFDQNKSGALLTSTATGTYTLASNGRAVLTFTTGGFSPAIAYLDGMNQGFVGATDNAASVGFIEPGGNNFGNSTLSGNYFLGTFDPAELQVGNSAGVASFNSGSTLQATSDNSHARGLLDGDSTFSVPYSVAPNGRLTFTDQGGAEVGYVASGCEVEIISNNNTNPGLISVECQVTPASAETLTVTLAGTGSGTVTDGSGAINCPTTCSANFPSGTQIVLTATPATGSTFTGWSGATCEGTSTCTFTITAATAVTANFGGSTNNFTLTVSEAGTGTGTVTSAPAGITCPDGCSASFASGTSVTLTAAAAAGSTFAGWSGAGCSGTGTCIVTVTAATPVTATFNKTTNNFALTVSEAGTGTGTVMSAPAGIICPTTCSANFASGTVVTLTAVAAEGSTFAGWSGAGCSGTGTCLVTVTAATTVTATFSSGNTPVIISVGPGSSSTVNTVPGGSAVFGLVLTGQTGFTGTVQLTCSSPIASITCNIVPSSVTLNGTTTSVAIVVNTFCKGFVPNGVPNDVPTPGGFGTGIGLLLVALSLCGAAWTFKKQPRWAVSFGLLIVFGVGMSACSNLAKSPSGSATPPGTYPLVVTATPPSGAPSHVNLTLVVK